MEWILIKKHSYNNKESKGLYRRSTRLYKQTHEVGTTIASVDFVLTDLTPCKTQPDMILPTARIQLHMFHRPQRPYELTLVSELHQSCKSCTKVARVAPKLCCYCGFNLLRILAVDLFASPIPSHFYF